MQSTLGLEPVVITGASGFLGRQLRASLLDHGRSVLALSRRPMEGMTTIDCYDAVPSGGCLVHLAEEPDRAKVNQMGMAYLNESKRIIGVLAARFGANMIYASSGTVYGDKGGCPFAVNSPTVDDDFYNRGKLANEEVVLGAGGIVVRLSNLYGMGMSSNNVMSDILRQIPGSGALRVRDAWPVRDFLHVSDAAAAIRMLLESAADGIFNLGSGVGKTIHSLAQLALDAAGEGGRIIESAVQIPSHSTNILDIAETRRVLAWNPTMSLEEYFVNFFQARTRAA
jgi:nucleoside-diphosphate-sugar epimerase